MTARHNRLVAEIARRPGWTAGAARVFVATLLDLGTGYSDADVISAARCCAEPASAGAK
jgi:hypothetical protein